MNTTKIDNLIKSLEENVNSLKGKVSVLEEQHTESTEQLLNLKESQITNSKAVELLNIVQTATKELICNIFETIVSNALTYIHQSNDYRFELDFDKRGNLPVMDFCLKTPSMQDAHDILETRGGGSCDIISLALRFVLLEVSRNKGFLFLDEPAKMLDNPETAQKMIEFVQKTQKATGRQILWITHRDEVVESVVNPIIIKKDNTKTIEKIIKKKRGRPRKEKE